PSHSPRIEGARNPDHWMSHSRLHHYRRLVGRTGTGPRAAAPRRRGIVHGHDRRGVHPDLDLRLGSAGARRDFAPWQLRRCARTSIAALGVLRTLAVIRLAAWSADLSFVSIPARPAERRVRRMKGSPSIAADWRLPLE